MKNLTTSQEDYLEAIYLQVLKSGKAKVTVISEFLGVKKASVSEAIGSLQKKELIYYEPYSAITLTEKGMNLAVAIHEKHKLMATFFEKIMLMPSSESVEAACKFEHVMSNELYLKFNKLLKFIEDYSSEDANFAKKLNNSIK